MFGNNMNLTSVSKMAAGTGQSRSNDEASSSSASPGTNKTAVTAVNEDASKSPMDSPPHVLRLEHSVFNGTGDSAETLSLIHEGAYSDKALIDASKTSQRKAFDALLGHNPTQDALIHAVKTAASHDASEILSDKLLSKIPTNARKEAYNTAIGLGNTESAISIQRFNIKQPVDISVARKSCLMITKSLISTYQNNIKYFEALKPALPPSITPNDCEYIIKLDKNIIKETIELAREVSVCETQDDLLNLLESVLEKRFNILLDRELQLFETAGIDQIRYCNDFHCSVNAMREKLSLNFLDDPEMISTRMVHIRNVLSGSLDSLAKVVWSGIDHSKVQSNNISRDLMVLLQCSTNLLPFMSGKEARPPNIDEVSGYGMLLRAREFAKSNYDMELNGYEAQLLIFSHRKMACESLPKNLHQDFTSFMKTLNESGTEKKYAANYLLRQHKKNTGPAKKQRKGYLKTLHRTLMNIVEKKNSYTTEYPGILNYNPFHNVHDNKAKQIIFMAMDPELHSVLQSFDSYHAFHHYPVQGVDTKSFISSLPQLTEDHHPDTLDETPKYDFFFDKSVLDTKISASHDIEKSTVTTETGSLTKTSLDDTKMKTDSNIMVSESDSDESVLENHKKNLAKHFLENIDNKQFVQDLFYHKPIKINQGDLKQKMQELGMVMKDSSADGNVEVTNKESDKQSSVNNDPVGEATLNILRLRLDEAQYGEGLFVIALSPSQQSKNL